MDKTLDLQYTDDAEVNRYFYYKDSQSVNFFVEDKNKEYVYEILFEQIFPDLEIKSIFTCGGKPAMEKLFYELGDKDSDNPLNPNIYIADGDFDRIIFSDRMIKHSHFIYLDAYNVESYFFDEKICVKLAMLKLEKCFKDTQQKIKIVDWYKKIITQSKELFFIYCYLQAYHPGIKTIGNSPYIFINSSTGFEKEKAIEQYKTNLSNDGIVLEDAKMEVIKQKYDDLYGKEYWHLICGKFLLISLMHYLKSKGVSVSTDELKRTFIINANEKKFDYLITKVNNVFINKKNEAS